MNDMDKAQELIRECRYYKGEESPPMQTIMSIVWLGYVRKSGLTWSWKELSRNDPLMAITIFGLWEY